MEDLARLSRALPGRVLLRPAGSGDAPAVLALAREMAASGAGSGVPEDDIPATAWAADWILGHREAGRLMLVAEADRQPVGFATASTGPAPRLSHVAQVGLFVTGPWRRRGIGGTLLDAVLDWASRSPGIDKLQLAVLAANGDAIRLYRDRGFRQEGRLRGQILLPDGTRVDQLLMARGTDRTGARTGSLHT